MSMRDDALCEALSKAPAQAELRPTSPDFRFVLACEVTPMISLGSIGRPILCLWGMTPYVARDSYIWRSATVIIPDFAGGL
jgi:hypothetical protein